MPAREILGADDRNPSWSKHAPSLADKVIETLYVLDDLVCVYHVEGAVLERPMGFEVTISNVELSTLSELSSLGHDLDSGDVGRRNAHSMLEALGPQSVIAADVEKRQGRLAWKDVQDLTPILGIHRLVQAPHAQSDPRRESKALGRHLAESYNLESQAGVFISRLRTSTAIATRVCGEGQPSPHADAVGCCVHRRESRERRHLEAGALRTGGRYDSRRRGRQRE